ncbi:DUF72 domain-containing protein [Pigmentiphaga kullae]|uniref:Uncharacterized protein YecE (DUF72 family) n=1 Tax=Pigmentiphaga kullae TaxID=151784 RepID=A0A4V2F2F7_9BURK|nr:DUF72 domain-containing protein [Pigmentiphaga kullae]RZS77988.1 uncharacterized protein YecE (DUF72 family) [Pigmentiphaga kullae]
MIPQDPSPDPDEPVDGEDGAQRSFFGDAPAPQPAKAKSRTKTVPAAEHPDTLRQLGAAMPGQLHLGTSSWAFAGWNGIVYGAKASESLLSREGLPAYSSHPLLNSVSLDRTFYAPLSAEQYAHYANQVPAGFRFVVKAPNLVTDAVLRDDRGAPAGPNPSFLDPVLATDHFVTPCLEGLGAKAGPLVFQFSPLPPEILGDPAGWVARLSAFLAALPPLPASQGHERPFYAVEFRDPQAVTPRMMKMLAERGVRYCVAIHARMPSAARQMQAVAATGPGPLVVRWSLLAGQRYEAAKARFSPFDKIQVQDPETRRVLAEAALAAHASGQPAWIVANNKAEGSAPLTLELLAGEIATRSAPPG